VYVQKLDSQTFLPADVPLLGARLRFLNLSVPIVTVGYNLHPFKMCVAIGRANNREVLYLECREVVEAK
jgi:hypothetical protein